jgi:hypothetical protein
VNRPADDVRIGGELLPPVAVREDNGLMRFGAIVRLKQTSRLRPDLQHAEIVGRDEDGAARGRQHSRSIAEYGFVADGERQHLREHAVVALKGLEECVWERERLLRGPRADSGDGFGRAECVGTIDRQRFEEQRVEHGEDRRVGADAQCEREHGHGGDGRRAAHHAQRMASVLAEILDRANSARVATFVGSLVHPTKGSPRRVACHGLGHAARLEFARPFIEMKADFIVELGFDLVGTQEGAQAKPRDEPPPFERHG